MCLRQFERSWPGKQGGGTTSHSIGINAETYVVKDGQSCPVAVWQLLDRQRAARAVPNDIALQVPCLPLARNRRWEVKLSSSTPGAGPAATAAAAGKPPLTCAPSDVGNARVWQLTRPLS